MKKYFSLLILFTSLSCLPAIETKPQTQISSPVKTFSLKPQLIDLKKIKKKLEIKNKKARAKKLKRYITKFNKTF